MSFVIADYRDHQQSLRTLLEASCQKPFLFIEGDEEYGKTWLLEWFRATLGQQRPILYFDLGAAHELYSPRVILAASVNAIGGRHFKRFAAHEEARRNRVRNAIISGNVFKGNNLNINANADGETAEERLLSAIAATNEFLEDFANLPGKTGPIVFAFDSYDEVEPDETMRQINQWLGQSLLPGLCKMAHARVIVAGRRVVTGAKPWGHCSAKIELKGVRDIRDWLEVVRILKKAYPEKAQPDPLRYLDIAIDVLQGVPGGIMRTLQGWPPESAGG